MSQPLPDFDKIRKAVEAITREYGGRANIEQWIARDGECLKIVMTWKKEQDPRWQFAPQAFKIAL